MCICTIERPKLKDLVLLEVAPEWYTLGLQLNLAEDKLNIIESDVGHDVKTCTRKMFSKWLSSNKDASYTDLVDALVAIDKKDVAEHVSQKFCKLHFLFKYVYHVKVCCYGCFESFVKMCSCCMIIIDKCYA